MIQISTSYDQKPCSQAESSALTVADRIQNQEYRFFDILDDHDHWQAVKDKADDLRSRFDTFIILGTGGSSLGAKTLCDLVQNPFQSKVHFLNNVDPVTIDHLLKSVDLAKTGFIAISKSGSTAETMMQTVCLMKVLETKGIDVKKHFEIITEDKQSPLDGLAETYLIDPLPHDKGIGGRFSVFSNVGLLPALLAGFDIDQLRSGAKSYIMSFLATPKSHDATSGASAAVWGLENGQNISVLMPYLDQLQSFAAWYGQLWAESLGKNGQGSTPIAALGTVDQHSLLQLFRDGPDDKMYTLVVPTAAGNTNFSPNGYVYTEPSLAYMMDQTMFDLLSAEAKATADSLKNAGRPVRTISLDVLNTETLGQLLAHFMLETIVSAEIMNINAFDQPGVEESKVLTRDYMTNLKSA